MGNNRLREETGKTSNDRVLDKTDFNLIVVNEG